VELLTLKLERPGRPKEVGLQQAASPALPGAQSDKARNASDQLWILRIAGLATFGFRRSQMEDFAGALTVYEHSLEVWQAVLGDEFSKSRVTIEQCWHIGETAGSQAAP